MTPGRSWPSLLSQLLAGESLRPEDTAWAMGEIMAGEASAAQIAAFAVALRAKGETPDEVAGLVATMLDRAERLTVSGDAVDTCGTGGDGAHTVNISTMAALVVRGAGITVVKHGNRFASSQCGSADLLEALGIPVDLEPEQVAACLAQAGIAFCFAPVFHPALRHAAVPRREMGVPTFFNFLGPLTNPAQPTAQAVGVGDLRMAPVVAGVLAARGTRGLVFRGDDGLDELTTTTTSRVWVVRDGAVTEVTFDPDDVGLARTRIETLRGGDAQRNAAVARGLLAGDAGPVRDAVLLNAAAAIVAVERPEPAQLTQQLQAALRRAADSIDSGAAAGALTEWAKAASRNSAA